MQIDKIKYYGANLLMTKLKLVGDPLEFFRQMDIYKWSLPDTMYPLKVIKDILWMRLLEQSEGMKLPNGCRWFCYTKFWGDVFPGGKRYYRIRKHGAKAWEIHSF